MQTGDGCAPAGRGPRGAWAARPHGRCADDGAGGTVYAAGRCLERAIGTHLFVISANHGGSTFLGKALAACRAAWSLPGEADGMPGFVQPARVGSPDLPSPSKLWAASRPRMDRLADPAGYDWPRNRKAWYFMARARDPEASVFVVHSPRALFQVDMLVRHFRNARFAFMVRNPYAACEGVCRSYRERRGADPGPAAWQGRGLEEWAALHVVNCLARQRRNVEVLGAGPRAPSGGRGVFFTYEAMCAAPERVAREIRSLVPELADLDLRRRLPVKGRYDEVLTDMNARQIARLDAGQIAAFNRVFHGRRDLLDHFGYEMLD